MVNEKTKALVKSFEGLFLKAYPDPATGNEPVTIGYGTTIYPGGFKVKMGDKISANDAEEYLKYRLLEIEKRVNKLLKHEINENQRGALISFAYNCGEGNLSKSTLLKKVNANPCDSSIKDEFMKWNKAAGKVMAGLTRRRKAEYELYIS